MIRLLLFSLPVVGFAAPFPGCQGGTTEGCPGVANCTLSWLQQPIDHFNWAPPLGNKLHTTFQQRFFFNEQWWSLGEDGSRGPIFFYFGNEDNVELYVNHTGLMWESAAEFGALLVFAEHRYYGETLPFEDNTLGCMSWLTTEQAMADFAYLIDHLHTWQGAERSPVIGFGGSYGGMIAAWFRLKYPNSVDGVIAASAPIWSFSGLQPPYDFNAFARGVTYDASSAGGATDHCKNAVKSGYSRIVRAAQSARGRELLQQAFRLCSPLSSDPGTADSEARTLAETFSSGGSFANMAMGNYPYASSYLMHGKSLLPPWPVRVACSHLARDFGADEDAALFRGLREATAVQLNNTGDVKCFTPSGRTFEPLVGISSLQSMRMPTYHDLQQKPSLHAPQVTSCQGSWGYQYCTEMTQPFVTGTSEDMYHCDDATQNCSAPVNSRWSPPNCSEWGVSPRLEWARIGLGGKHLASSSNIVFSNGLLDPWHGGGVLADISTTVIAIIIPNGAHHIDLMFSDPADAHYSDIGAARAREREEMHRWVNSARGKYSSSAVYV